MMRANASLPERSRLLLGKFPTIHRSNRGYPLCRALQPKAGICAIVIAVTRAVKAVTGGWGRTLARLDIPGNGYYLVLECIY